MKVTVKGQVTIPRKIREKLGIGPFSEIDFVEEGDRVYIVGKKNDDRRQHRFSKHRDVAAVRMTTDEIMALTRSG